MWHRLLHPWPTVPVPFFQRQDVHLMVSGYVIGLMVLLGYATGASAVAAADGPTHVVNHLVQTIARIKVTENGALSPDDRVHNAAAASAANAILDIPQVSQRVLGRHWKQRTPQEQKEFTTLLTDLFINVAYPKSAELFSDLDVQVTGERITGERAVVNTTVRDPKEGLISVDYKLQQRNGTWRIRDIVLDDVSLARNLRSQCHKIITQHSYAELLRRMRDKLAE